MFSIGFTASTVFVPSWLVLPFREKDNCIFLGFILNIFLKFRKFFSYKKKDRIPKTSLRELTYCWRIIRSDESDENVSFITRYGGQFTFST